MKPEILNRAKEIGGKRLLRLITRMEAAGVKFPILPENALKYHGLGKKAFHEFEKLGLLQEGPANPFRELSVRAWNVLSRLNLTTKEAVKECILAGKLHPDFKGRVTEDQGTRNYGWKTHREVLKWVGLPVPAPVQNKCCKCGVTTVPGIRVTIQIPLKGGQIYLCQSCFESFKDWIKPQCVT